VTFSGSKPHIKIARLLSWEKITHLLIYNIKICIVIVSEFGRGGSYPVLWR